MGRPKKVTMTEALEEIRLRELSKPLTKTYLTRLKNSMSVREWSKLKTTLRSRSKRSKELYNSFVDTDRRATGKRRGSMQTSGLFSSSSFHDVSLPTKGVGNESVIMSTLLGDHPNLFLDIRRWWVVTSDDGDTDYRPTKKGIRLRVEEAQQVLEHAATMLRKLRLRKEAK